MTVAQRWSVLVAGSIVGPVAMAALIWGGYQVPTDVLAPTIVMSLAIGWSFIGVGVIVWSRPGGNRTGLLMVLLGFAWFLRFVVAVASYPALLIGVLFGSLYLSLLVHLIVTYPSGRIENWAQGLIVGLGYLLGQPMNALFLVLSSDLQPYPAGPPPNDVVIVPPEAWAPIDLGSLVLQSLVVVLCGSLITVLILRWRRWNPPLRRSTAPAVLGAVLIAAVILLQRTAFLRLLPVGAAVALSWLAQVVMIVWPLALLIGVVRSQLDRAAVGRLLVDLGSGIPVPDRLRASLAVALHDPSVQISYWLAEQQTFVDSRGLPAEVGTVRAGRAVSYLERDGARIAALVHDATVEPTLVEAVAAGAALAVDNERLNAELTAQLRAVRQSSSRIVEAADAARRRVERDLHDGSQQRLLSVALALRLTRSELTAGRTDIGELIAEARAELATALDELTALARGIYPATLTDRGLQPALAELAERSPVPASLTGGWQRRLPAAVEHTAYFVVSEALANAEKHAHCSRVDIRLSGSRSTVQVEIADDGRGGASLTGSGLRGLADRIAAVDGRLGILSPQGGGTRLMVEMPCE